MLSKEVSSTIFKVFGMTRAGIEPRPPGSLANTQSTRKRIYMYVRVCVCVCVCVCLCAHARVCLCVLGKIEVLLCIIFCLIDFKIRTSAIVLFTFCVLSFVLFVEQRKTSSTFGLWLNSTSVFFFNPSC